MKYTYAYKTSDGKRHESAMEAASREAVFEQLRTQGIKAIKVVAADGSKANGEVRGVRKRVVAFGALCLVLGAIVAVLIAFRAGEASSDSQGAGHQTQDTTFLTDTTRRQVIGDVAIIEKGIRTGWTDVFKHEGDRFLASFAIPGVKAGVRNTSVAEIEKALASTVEASPADGFEAKQIKAMVEGMKREARSYIAAGGTIVEYGKRLTERQDEEIAIFKRVEAEVLAARGTMDESSFMAYLDRHNDELRVLGICPVTLPD